MRFNLCWPLLAILVAFAVVLPGCATFGIGPQGSDAQVRVVLEQASIKGGVVAGIQAVAQNDPQVAAALAKAARDTMDAVGQFITDPDNVQVTFQTLHDFVTAQIAAQHLDPMTVVTVDTIRQLVDVTLQDAMATKDLATILTPAVITGLKMSMGSIRDGLTLAGY